MTLTLTKPDDLDLLLILVAEFHVHEGIVQSDVLRRGAIAPLLEGSELGEIWLIGPRAAPVGYVALGFGWSIEFGGADAFVDEVFVTPTARGQGAANSALNELSDLLAMRGVKALHLEVGRTNSRARDLYAGLGFSARAEYHLMSKAL